MKENRKKQNNTKIVGIFLLLVATIFDMSFHKKQLFIFKLFTNHIFHLRCKMVVVKQELNSFSCSINNGDKDRQVCSQYHYYYNVSFCICRNG
jgi:hypothetical protein